MLFSADLESPVSDSNVTRRWTRMSIWKAANEQAVIIKDVHHLTYINTAWLEGETGAPPGSVTPIGAVPCRCFRPQPPRCSGWLRAGWRAGWPQGSAGKSGAGDSDSAYSSHCQHKRSLTGEMFISIRFSPSEGEGAHYTVDEGILDGAPSTDLKGLSWSVLAGGYLVEKNDLDQESQDSKLLFQQSICNRGVNTSLSAYEPKRGCCKENPMHTTSTCLSYTRPVHLLCRTVLANNVFTTNNFTRQLSCT